jgi:stage III sporulation protein SpoIIIAA
LEREYSKITIAEAKVYVMGRYFDGKKQGIDSSQKEIIKETIVEKETDTDAIAKAVIDAIKGNIGNIGSISSGSNLDTFSDKDTMKALAESMTVQRGDSESNFEDLGNIKETKKDKKETDAAIDFLKDVDDKGE